MEINPDVVRWSAPERERAGRPLLVLMHGYLSHEGDLFGLSPLMPLGPVIASLRAPLALETGFAWFPISDDATAPGESGTEKSSTAQSGTGKSDTGQSDTAQSDTGQFEAANDSARAVLSWLDTVQATSVGLLGFSQGGAMALQLLRHAPERFAYAVQLSGFALPGELEGDRVLSERKPPVFWGRGTLDEVIPVRAIEFTEAWLPQHATLTTNIYEDVAHAISERELSDAGRFIREHLG